MKKHAITEEHVKLLRRRPSTPGDLLADLLECNNLSQAEAARRLGVTRQTVIHLLQGRRSLTLDMAQRLGRLFGNGPTIWLKFQQACEMWDLMNQDTAPYRKIRPLSAASRNGNHAVNRKKSSTSKRVAIA